MKEVIKGVIHIAKLGMSAKESSFVQKWSAIQKKGKLRYIFSRGLAFGLLLYSVWLLVTVIEIMTSDFQKALYSEHHSTLIEKGVIWFVCYMAVGFVIARGSWKHKEEKMKYLS